jgi:hypothetical protein
MDQHEKTFNLKKKEKIINKKVKNIPDKEKLQLLKEGKIFPEVEYEDKIYYFILSMNLLIFLIVLFLLIRCLYLSQSNNDDKFIWICIFIFLYPILHIIRAFFEVYSIKDKDVLGIDPLFPPCIDGYFMLTETEKDAGAIAKIDYKCWQKQRKYLFQQSKTLSDQSHFLIKILFTIVIFLFGLGKVNTFQYKLITQNQEFLKICLQTASVVGVILLSSIILGEANNYLALLQNVFFKGLYTLNITILMVFISYLSFNLFVFYF